MADLQYLVFVGAGGFLAAIIFGDVIIDLAIAAYGRHRSGRASHQAASRLGQATITYRIGELA